MEADKPNRSKNYERQDAKAKPLFLFILALFALIVVVAGILFFYLKILESHSKKSDLPSFYEIEEPLQIPEPRLEIHPSSNYQALKEKEDYWLSTYGWSSLEHGKIHIPIEEAMRLIAEQGLPTQESSAPEQEGV